MRSAIVDRILEKRKNGSLVESSFFFYKCLTLSNEVLEKQELTDREYFYYIVSYVTNAEAFFRHLLKELIDKDPNNVYAIGKILEDNFSKKDLIESISATGTKKVSIGEIFSHAVSISSVNQIIDYFDVFTNKKTKTILFEISKTQTFQQDFEDDRIEFRFENCFDSIALIFKLRHILCHENPDYNCGSKRSLQQHLFNASGLLDLFRILVDQILGIPEFRCEADRRNFMSQNCERKSETLDKLISKISHGLTEYEASFNKDNSNGNALFNSFTASQIEWKKFSQIDSSSVSNKVYGGSAMIDFYLQHLEMLLDQRIEVLRATWSEYLK